MDGVDTKVYLGSSALIFLRRSYSRLGSRPYNSWIHRQIVPWILTVSLWPLNRLSSSHFHRSFPEHCNGIESLVRKCSR
jgi:hypothetical protein